MKFWLGEMSIQKFWAFDSKVMDDVLLLEQFQFWLFQTETHQYMHIIWLQISFLIQLNEHFWNLPTQNFRKCVGEMKFSNLDGNIYLKLRDLGMVARVIDEIDDENWLMMFVQELEVHVKQIIQMEKKIKQLIHQAREGRADGYKELIKVLLQFLNFSNSNETKTNGHFR